MRPEERYARQIALPEIGVQGQRRLAGSSVLVVGAGGLGSPVALYLTAAGVGRIGIADADRVGESNLQRQVLYSESDIGRLKTEAAADRLHALSSGTVLETYGEELTPENGGKIVARYDIIVECSDNFATRYTVDELCLKAGKPWVYGSIDAFSGQVSLFTPRCRTRYADLYPDRETLSAKPPSSGGVLGTVAAIIGSVQASEALKWLAGFGITLEGRLFTLNVAAMECRTFEI